MPDSHRVVAEHDGLIANVDLGDFFDPDELVHDVFDDAVVVAKNEVDLLAANLLPVTKATLGPPMQKSPRK